ncbi:MAG: RNA polymerase sigma-70 factor [Chryseolinea sp.]
MFSHPAKSVTLDPELIARIRKGDTKSLELLFRRLYPRLFAYANKFLHDHDDSKEIVQDVFLSLWNHRSKLDETKSLDAFLFTLVKNRSLNLLKSKAVQNRRAELMLRLYANELSFVDNTHQILLANELQSAFDKALNTLPTECRRVFELSRMEGLRYHEIAAKLNISIKTVETQMYRALSKLRLELRHHLAILSGFLLLDYCF